MKYKFIGKFYSYLNDVVNDAENLSEQGWELVSHSCTEEIWNGQSSYKREVGGNL